MLRLSFLLTNAYTVNGGQIRRQIMGIPMGLCIAPQLANLACYPEERDFMLTTRAVGLAGRYIDVIGVRSPSTTTCVLWHGVCLDIQPQL